MCSHANRETVVKGLGNYNAGNEQQIDVKYICVNFVVDDDEMVPFVMYGLGTLSFFIIKPNPNDVH
jgi:hypothetical protein